ncbi:acyl-CoA dehydrogenase family protein [Streptomyces sp. UG1]|uniref:acyl-CoA dehydrogenase family protein n=1 Tax=Streptomyces sp. UG1 TaxID=3417652 RepID=UPI003CEAC176
MSSDERDQLRQAVARLLTDRAPVDTVPDTVAEAPGYDTRLWQLLADQGFLGLLVPAGLGGSEGSMGDVAVLAGEMGRVLLPGPFLTSAVQATTLVVAAAGAGSASARALAARLAEGTATACVVDDRGVTAYGEPASGLVLSGTARRVVGADPAAVLLVAVDIEGSGDRVVVQLPAEQAGLAPSPLADATRRAADVTFDRVEVSAQDTLLGGEAARLALKSAALRLMAAVAADASGGAAAVLAMATEYAKTRHQFDRAIGSFQAVKHKLADMYIRTESTTAAAERAAQALEEGLPDAPRRVTAAGAHGTSAYISVAGDAIQVHGGIGFTWEHPCHRFLKRAWLNQMLLGGRRALSDTFAESLFASAATSS